MLILQLILIFVGGLAGGFYGSMVGGGALVTLPLLILIGLPAPLALGTQRFGAVVMELVSSIRFYRARRLNLKLGLKLGAIGVLGSIVGVNFLLAINVKTMNLIVAILLLVVTIILLNKDRLGFKEHPLAAKNRIWLALATAIMGVYVGFFGVGSGVFWVLLLVAFGFNFIESAGIARVVGTFTSLASAIVFGLHGLINYPLAITLGAGFGIGSWIGIGVTLDKGEKYIKALLLLVVAYSVIKLILNTLGVTQI